MAGAFRRPASYAASAAASVVPDELLVISERELDLRTLRRQPPRALRRVARAVGVGAGRRPHVVVGGVCPRELHPGLHERRVERHRLAVVVYRATDRPGVGDGQPLGGLFAFQVCLVGREVLGRLLGQRFLLRRTQRHVQRLGHAARDVGLDLEHIGDGGVERLLPRGRGRADPDQLGAHPHPIPRGPLLPPHGAGEQIVHPQLPADLLRRLARLLVLSRAAPRDHLESAQRGQLPAHFVGDAVREVLVFGGAQVLEGQHRHPLGPGGRVVVPTVRAQPAEQDPQPEQEADRQRRGERETEAARACRLNDGGRVRRRRRGCRAQRLRCLASRLPLGERTRELRRAAEPVRRRLGQRLGHGALDVRGHRFPQLPQEARRLDEPACDDRLSRGPGERRLARQRLVEHAAEGVDVAPMVDRPLPRGLLGTHVGRRPERGPGFRELALGCAGDRPRNAEVRHQRVISGEQDVLRLDVAVDDVVPVRVLECVRRFAPDPEHVFDRQLPLARRGGRAATRPRRTASRTRARSGSTRRRPPRPSRGPRGCGGAAAWPRAGSRAETARGRGRPPARGAAP